MADKHYTLSEDAAKRTARAVRRVESEPYPSQRQMAPWRPHGPLGMFVVASDPSEYGEPLDLLPLGYRGHVIAYPLLDGHDLTDLPEVPSLDSLLQAAASNGGLRGVRDWERHPWVDEHKDDRLGRPVLINVCRYTSGAFHRGQIVAASFLPGFRCADAWRGEHFAYAAPTWGEWPDADYPASREYQSLPGWCAISPGHTSLIVTLSGDLDPSADPEYAEAEIKSLTIEERALELVDPSDDEATTTLWVYSDSDEDGSALDADSDQAVSWDHQRFRWQVLRGGGGASGLQLGKTDGAISKGASGTVSIWDGAAGSESDTGENVTAYNRFAAVGSGKWVMVGTTDTGERYLIAAEC